VALTPEEKRRFLKALEEDEASRMAVADIMPCFDGRGTWI
jgi:hypothetical protein